MLPVITAKSPSSVFACVLLLLVVAALSLSAESQATSSEPLFPRHTKNIKTDVTIEAELDQYLELSEQQPQQASELIELIVQKKLKHAPHTAARTLSYTAYDFQIRKKTAEVEQILEKLTALAEQQNDADIWIEAITSQMDFLQYTDSKKAHSLLAKLLEYLPDAQQTRLKYYGHITAATYQEQDGKFEKALQHLQSALDSLASDQNPRNPLRRISLKSQMAQLQASMRHFDNALQMNADVLADATAGNYHQRLPGIYLQKGFIEVGIGHLDAAIESNKTCVKLADSTTSQSTRITCINNLGDIYMRKNMLEEAQTHFQQVLNYALAEKEMRTAALAEFNLGYIQVKQGFGRQGSNRMKAAIQNQMKTIGKTEHMLLLKELADAYDLAKMYEEETQALREHSKLSEELFQLERDKQLNKLQEEFSSKQKEAEIIQLRQENQLKEGEIQNKRLQQNIFALIVIIVILAATLLYQLYRKVQQANLSLKEANAKLAYQSTRDPLTGLHNRRAFQEHMQHRKQSNERRHIQSFKCDGLILLDIDHFKQINDQHGHATGDAVLVETAKRLQTISRTDDMILRWGGEEFLLLMRNVDIETLTLLTERVLNGIGGTLYEHDGKQLSVTASAGFLTLPFSDLDEEIVNWEKALHLADMALYLGKVHGRNRAYGLQKLTIPYNEIREVLETDLSKAIDSNYLSVAQVLGPKQPSH